MQYSFAAANVKIIFQYVKFILHIKKQKSLPAKTKRLRFGISLHLLAHSFVELLLEVLGQLVIGVEFKGFGIVAYDVSVI